MIPIWAGTYDFNKHNIVEESGKCSGCYQESVLTSYDCFRMWHVYYIPLIPFGFWHVKERCSNCEHSSTLSKRKWEKKRDAAIRAAHTAAQADPTSEEEAIALHKQIHTYGTRNEAYLLSRSLVDRFPDSPRVQKYLGRWHSIQGRSNDAIEVLRPYVEKESKDSIAQLHLARAYSSIGQAVPAGLCTIQVTVPDGRVLTYTVSNENASEPAVNQPQALLINIDRGAAFRIHVIRPTGRADHSFLVYRKDVIDISGIDYRFRALPSFSPFSEIRGIQNLDGNAYWAMFESISSPQLLDKNDLHFMETQLRLGHRSPRLLVWYEQGCRVHGDTVRYHNFLNKLNITQHAIPPSS